MYDLSPQLNYVKGLDPELKKTLIACQSFLSSRINSYLIGYEQEYILNKTLLRMKNDLREIFKNVPPLKQDIIVYRSAYNVLPDNGEEIYKGSYLSTSLNKKATEIYAFDDKPSIMYTFYIPKGSKIIPLFELGIGNEYLLEILVENNGFNCRYKNISENKYEYELNSDGTSDNTPLYLARCCENCSDDFFIEYYPQIVFPFEDYGKESKDYIPKEDPYKTYYEFGRRRRSHKRLRTSFLPKN